MFKYLWIVAVAGALNAQAEPLPKGTLCEDSKGRMVEITGYENGKYHVDRFGPNFNYIGHGKVCEKKLKNCQVFGSIDAMKDKLFRSITNIPSEVEEETAKSANTESPTI